MNHTKLYEQPRRERVAVVIAFLVYLRLEKLIYDMPGIEYRMLATIGASQISYPAGSGNMTLWSC